MSHIRRDIFAALLIVFSFLLGSCVGGPEPVEFSRPPGTAPIDPDSNILIHNGISMAIPDRWRFQSNSVSAGSESSLVRAYGPDRSTLSVYRVSFDFPVEPDRLHSYVYDQLGEKGEMVQLGPFPAPPARPERNDGYYWVVRDDRDTTTIILEGTGQEFLEWRSVVPITADQPGNPGYAIIQHTGTAPEEVSYRRTAAGFTFSSMDTPWRWVGDVGDGFLVERLRAPEEERMIVGLFSRESIPDGDTWISDTAREGETVPVTTLSVGGYQFITTLHLLRFNTREVRIVVPVQGDGPFVPFFVTAVITGPGVGDRTAQDLLGSPEIRTLLNTQVRVPPAGSP
jgi:hypothetical protein